MSFTSFHLCAKSLLRCLPGVCWERHGWKDLKHEIEDLLRSIFNYANYLTKQCDTMKWVHSSPHPVHQMSENLAFVTCLFVLMFIHAFTKLSWGWGRKTFMSNYPLKTHVRPNLVGSMNTSTSWRNRVACESWSPFLLAQQQHRLHALHVECVGLNWWFYQS